MRAPQFPPPMADMHSHILPGVDDGARTMEDALELLNLAVKDGVMIQILTPHLRTERYKNNTRQSLQERFEEFHEAVELARIPIELHLAAEVRICHEIMQMVDDEGIPWLGNWNGQKTFLLEFPQNGIPAGSENLVEWLRNENILPVIAHPERNIIFQKYPDKLQPFLEMGCPLQVTAGSVTGQFGRAPKKLAHRLIKEGTANLLASDCHNRKYRPPNLSQGVKAAAKLIGKAAAADMATSNVFDLQIGDRHREAM